MNRFAVSALCALLSAMVMGTPASAAILERQRVPFVTQVASCQGENIRLKGEFLYIIESHENPNGSGYQVHFTGVPRHIESVGSDGTRYRAVGANTDTFVVTPSGRYIDTETSHLFTLISKGKESNVVLHAVTHLTVFLPDFEIVSLVDRVFGRCTGS